MSTANKPYSRSQIRAELFRLGNGIRNMRNAHLVACGLDHQNPCHVCDRFAGEISGINDAIRHFGGRTQLIVPGLRK